MNRVFFSPKMFYIAAQTFRQHVTRRGYIFFAFIVPMLGALLVCGAAFGLLATTSGTMRLGVVDEAGVVVNTDDSAQTRTAFQFERFENETTAKAAWRAGTLDGYFVLKRAYMQTGHVSQVTRLESASPARAAFETFLRAQLLEKTDRTARERILGGTLFSRQPLNPNQIPNMERVNSLVLAGLLIICFFILNQFTQNYLWHAVRDEHANRTIEIILTSVSLAEFFVGKVLGIALAGLTPMIVWGSVIGVGVGIGIAALQFFGAPFDARANWQLLGWGLLILTPAYPLGATTTVLGGALTTILDQNHSLHWFLEWIPVVILLPLTLVALSAPDSALAVGLSLIPWTAPIVLTLRLGITDVPLWQIGAAIVLEWLALIGIFQLSVRVYRGARQGKLSLRQGIG